jgi:hypothetical protein
MYKLALRSQVRTAKKAQRVTITKINWLMLEIIAVCSENRTKPINAFCVQTAELIITYLHIYHSALKG